jgi:hypothetical protein
MHRPTLMGTYLTVVTVLTVPVTDLTVVMMEVVVYVLRPFLTVFQGHTLVHFPAQPSNLSRFWSPKPHQASTSKLNLRRFLPVTPMSHPQIVVTSRRKVNACSPQKVRTLS